MSKSYISEKIIKDLEKIMKEIQNVLSINETREQQTLYYLTFDILFDFLIIDNNPNDIEKLKMKLNSFNILNEIKYIINNSIIKKICDGVNIDGGAFVKSNNNIL